MPVLIARTAGVFALTVGLFVGVACGAVASDEELGKRNPDQHMNFDCSSCTHDTTVDHGYTYIYATCYGQLWSNTAHWSAEGTSPEVGVTCQYWDKSTGSINCVSDTKHAHTVKVTIYSCSQP